jgi:acyl-CoA synthetase (AMP-forming)/AMP-acid ligase II
VHGLDHHDTVLVPTSLAHVSGVLNGLLVPAVAGMKAVLLAGSTTAHALERIERERVTYLAGPPAIVTSLLRDPAVSPRRARSLRLVVIEGPGIDGRLLDDATLRLGALVKRSYGRPEAPVVTTTDTGAAGASRPPDALARELRDTDGRPLGDAEVRVVDEDGHDVAPPTRGAIWVRGPELCAGYTDAAATERAFARGGWVRTGDRGALLADGTLVVDGEGGGDEGEGGGTGARPA